MTDNIWSDILILVLFGVVGGMIAATIFELIPDKPSRARRAILAGFLQRCPCGDCLFNSRKECSNCCGGLSGHFRNNLLAVSAPSEKRRKEKRIDGFANYTGQPRL